MYEVEDPQNRKISFFIEVFSSVAWRVSYILLASLNLQEASIGYPTVPETNVYSKSVKIYPSECRQRAVTYKAKLSVTFKWLVDGQPVGGATRVLGQVPIMIKVKLAVPLLNSVVDGM